jgi:hypothetical protein
MKLNEISDKANIEQILNKLGVKNYTINPDGSVDVDGEVNITSMGLAQIPVKFGYVSGYVDCSHNNLTSLNGAPREVGGDFWCQRNKLTSLNGAPREVGGNFMCYKNNLTSLKGAPREVGEDFWCQRNKLTSLKGAPREVGGNFWCYGNKFEYEPDHSFIKIGGEFEWR